MLATSPGARQTRRHYHDRPIDKDNNTMVPTLAQAQGFAQTLRSKFGNVPGLSARIDRAIDLVVAGDVFASRGDHYAILSAKNDGTAYHLDTAGRCDCPDAVRSAPFVRGAARCKHNLAAEIHFRTLIAGLNTRILGSRERGNRMQQHNHPNTFLLLIPGSGRTSLWSDSVGHLARVTWSNALSGHQPATVADRINIEQWIDHADELPIAGQYMAELAAYDAATAAAGRYDEIHRDTPPVMSQAEFARWLDTGEVSAMPWA